MGVPPRLAEYDHHGRRDAVFLQEEEVVLKRTGMSLYITAHARVCTGADRCGWQIRKDAPLEYWEEGAGTHFRKLRRKIASMLSQRIKFPVPIKKRLRLIPSNIRRLLVC